MVKEQQTSASDIFFKLGEGIKADFGYLYLRQNILRPTRICFRPQPVTIKFCTSFLSRYELSRSPVSGRDENRGRFDASELGN
jgi:hypothetical protein